MKQATRKQISLFEFMRAHKNFNIDELVHATKYKRSTVETYLRKRLLNHFVVVQDGRYATTDEFNGADISEFVEQLCQTSRRCR